ncbi:MAG: hypothetical protein H6559_34065 [Lewinellaceae bacterium]|nr:hypothetical protein [Lewinellaceae bacterium]
MKNWIKMFCLFAGLMLMANAAEAQYRTRVYVNNQELTLETLTALQQYTGVLVPGAYYIDAYGNFGVVGFYPSFNLVQVINARQQAQNSYQQRYSNNSYRYSQSGGSDYIKKDASGTYGKEGGTSFWHSNYNDASIIRSGSDVILRNSDGEIIHTSF